MSRRRLRPLRLPAGDPQLHTHVVIANKVQTVMDGRWRSLDGRPVFASRTGCRRCTTRCSPIASPETSASSGNSASGALTATPLGDRGRAGLIDRGVLEPDAGHRNQEGRAHRRVRRPPRAAALRQGDRPTPGPRQRSQRDRPRRCDRSPTSQPTGGTAPLQRLGADPTAWAAATARLDR